VLEADPQREHFHFSTGTSAATDRKQSDARRQNYIPCNLGEIPDYYRRFIDPPEIMVVKTRPADATGSSTSGRPTCGTARSASRAKTGDRRDESGRSVRARNRERRARKPGRLRHRRPATGLCLSSRTRPPTDVDRDVARLIATEIDDGSCLQIGIGAMPNACAPVARDAACATSGSTPRCSPTASSTSTRPAWSRARRRTFTAASRLQLRLGSQELYDTIDDNADFSCQPVEMTNLPH
jgi:acyl-CoA hydrolase